MTTEFNSAEKEIIRLVIKGDSSAFTSLYHRYVENVYLFALRYMKSREEAENITQEVFVKVWETRKRIDPNNSLNAYLYTITKNIIFNIHRKKLNEQAYIEHLGRVISHPESSTEKEVFFRELRDQIDQCINRLPTQRKRVFIMSRNDGLSHKEIAHHLGISEKTIAAHIRLALQAIRKFLKEDPEG